MNDSPLSTTSPRSRRRVRIRFAKTGDLQWIGHRDLVRAFERGFRRARWELAMSEGFHPRPKMSFPTALGIGIRATDEVMEVELYEPVDPDLVAEQLRSVMPVGLEINSVALQPEGARKLRVARMCYELPIPPERQGAVRDRISQVWDQPDMQYTREGRSESFQVRRDIERLELQGGRLHLVQRPASKAAIRPREILEVLGCDDCQHLGLTRTQVILVRDSR